MVLIPDKYSSTLFGVRDEFQTDLVSNNVTIRNSKEEKVLGITFDYKFDLSTYPTSITKKASIKLNALTRVQKFLISEQKNFLTSSS